MSTLEKQELSCLSVSESLLAEVGLGSHFKIRSGFTLYFSGLDLFFAFGLLYKIFVQITTSARG